mgnify:CR=1 FL=1
MPSFSASTLRSHPILLPDVVVYDNIANADAGDVTLSGTAAATTVTVSGSATFDVNGVTQTIVSLGGDASGQYLELGGYTGVLDPTPRTMSASRINSAGPAAKAEANVVAGVLFLPTNPINENSVL